MQNQKKKTKTWLKVPSGQTVVQMKFAEMPEPEASLETRPARSLAERKVSQPGNKNKFLDTVSDIESRIIKFGNVDNMERHKRRNRYLNFYDETDPFIEESAGKFRNQVVIPTFDDFFAFNGSIADFVKSNLVDQKLQDHNSILALNEKATKKMHGHPGKKGKPPKLEVPMRKSKRIRVNRTE